VSRCDQGGPQDNKAIAARTAALRVEKARLLGYPTWADYVLADQMAGTPGAAYGLLALFVTGFLLIALGPVPEGTWLALLAAFPAGMAMRSLLRGQLLPAMPLTLATHASVCLLLVVGLLPH